MDKPEILDVRPSLTGKVAFVTGGLGGIGQACVKALVAHGCNVAFTYAEGHEPESRASNFVELNPEHLSAHALSLQSSESIKTSMQEAMNRWGRIDILINNAAVGSATVAAYADDLETQDSAIFAINADGALKVCQTFLALMEHSILETPLNSRFR